jgi:hypothetical protein
MKFEITVFTNLPDTVIVKNVSKQYFKREIRGEMVHLAPGKSKELLKGLAKIHFGNWEPENEYIEKDRRKMLGISHFEPEILYKEFKKQEVQKSFAGAIEIDVKEEEFAGLNDDEIEDICGFITQSGKPCKRKPFKDGKCSIHQSK